MATTSETTNPNAMHKAVVSCSTSGCPYEGVQNVLAVFGPVADAQVVCGGCRSEITDIKPVSGGTELGVVADA